MGKSFRGFPFDRFRTHMWNMNITYRGQTEIFKKHKQNPSKNGTGKQAKPWNWKKSGIFAEKFHNSPPVARIELKKRPMAMIWAD